MVAIFARNFNMFPVINNISDVLPHIQDNPNFSVNQKDDYIVIDYILSTPETFQNEWEKECRGIIFYADTGDLMCRRLHKFFNVNERTESSIEVIDFSRPHKLLEKLDGSMITPMITQGKLTWGSKAGVTFLTPQIEEFVKDKFNYQRFALGLMITGYTPIFEWCSRKNRIVIDHPVDRLVLIAIRNNLTGEYDNYNNLKFFADHYDLDYVKEEGSVEDILHTFNAVKGMNGVEGFVVAFDNGERYKIKADEYVMFHKAKDDFIREKNIISMIVDGKVDDFSLLLNKEDRQRLEYFEYDFLVNIRNSCENIQDFLDTNILTRKDFAMLVAPKLDPNIRALIFNFYDQQNVGRGDILKEIYAKIKKSCGSAAAIDKVRFLWNNLNWSDYINR
jgi:RNA ligase